MIKLSNSQIDALCRKIKNDILAPAKEHNKAIRESEEYKNFYDTNADCLTLKALDAKYHMSYVSSELSKVREYHFKDKYKEEPYIKDQDIETEVLLATIDASDLQALIETVSKKFK